DVAAGRQVAAVAIDPKGSWLACACPDRSVRLYDAKTGKAHHVLTAPAAAAYLSFSPDGKQLAAAHGSAVQVWASASGKALFELTGHSEAVKQVRFSPDGATLLSASADHTLRLWDVKSAQKKSRVLKGHTNEVLAVAFSPDGTRLASSSSDKTVR